MSDAAVEAARGGDAQKRDLVVSSLANAVRAMVVVRLAPSGMRVQDVDDLVQDSLAAISEGISSLRSPSVAALRAFASTIVSRKVATYLSSAAQGSSARSVSLDAEVGDGSSAAALRDLLSASGISPGSIAARREQIHNLLTRLAELKDRHREVITLAIIDQLSITEVAQRMGVSRPAASMLLFRAMKTLRRHITGSSRIGDDHETGD